MADNQGKPQPLGSGSPQHKPHDTDSDEVFEEQRNANKHHSPKQTPETHRRERSREREHYRSRSSERHATRHSSKKSRNSDLELHECTTKTELLRASAKRAEEKRRSSAEQSDNHHHKTRQKAASMHAHTGTPKKSPVQSASARRQSVAIIEVQRPRHKREASCSPKRSLSNSPKHTPVSATNSKSSLLEKQNSAASTPMRSYAGLVSSGQTAPTGLFPNSGSSGYSRPAMEVAVAALVFGAGVVTLIVSLIIGSNAWMIVGAISMGIGGVFIAFGACFYMSRHKSILGNEEQVEIRIVDQKQLAELSGDGFKVRAVMDL